MTLQLFMHHATTILETNICHCLAGNWSMKMCTEAQKNSSGWCRLLLLNQTVCSLVSYFTRLKLCLSVGNISSMFVFCLCYGLQMDLMLGDIPHLLDSLRGWVVPRENGDDARYWNGLIAKFLCGVILCWNVDLILPGNYRTSTAVSVM